MIYKILPDPWEFVFENFAQILKLRGLRPYAWVFYFQNHPMCISYYAGHFDMPNWGYSFDFTSTHAFSTPLISIFRSAFYSKPFFLSRPQGRHRSHHASLLKRPRKRSKVNFPWFFQGNRFELGIIGNIFQSSTF